MGYSYRINVYESGGSDGYSPGTWGWQFITQLEDGRESLSRDGGYPSRGLARQAGERRAYRIEGWASEDEALAGKVEWEASHA